MNAIATLITNCRDSILPTVTVGTIKSTREGDIVLVYLNENEANSFVLRYDQLSWKDRDIIQTIAQDPLSVLKRWNAQDSASH
jgi:hypothetical protein